MECGVQSWSVDGGTKPATIQPGSLDYVPSGVERNQDKQRGHPEFAWSVQNKKPSWTQDSEGKSSSALNIHQ